MELLPVLLRVLVQGVCAKKKLKRMGKLLIGTSILDLEAERSRAGGREISVCGGVGTPGMRFLPSHVNFLGRERRGFSSHHFTLLLFSPFSSRQIAQINGNGDVQDK